MRAAYYDHTGAPHDVLRVGSLPDPEPGPGEVRVAVHASGINPSDTKKRAGWGAYRQMEFPRIVPHNDGAGVIDAVGAGVATDRIGERVWVYEAQRHGRAFGTAAELVVVPADNAVRLPDGVPFATGAALGVPAMTAHRCLFQDGPITGQTILVAGGGGSVGRHAVQLARWGGAARVIATVGSDRQGAAASAAGADAVVRYDLPDPLDRLRAAIGGEAVVDRVVEVAFGANVDVDVALLRLGGAVSTYANTDDPTDRPKIPFQQLAALDATLHFVMVYAMTRDAHRQAAEDITRALASGALTPATTASYPLERIADAHAAVGIGGRGEKVILALSDS